MKFHDLEKKHYNDVARHYVKTFNAPPWNDKWTNELVIQKIEEIMDSSGALGLICTDDDGNFAGAVFGNSEIYYDCNQFFIKDIFVTLELQGKKIGALIIDELEKRLRKMDISKIYFFTEKDSLAESFYKKQGYSRWDSLILMGKSI